MLDEKDSRIVAKTAGYVAGALAVPFIEWVLENAEYPVKLALGGSEPIAVAARKLSKAAPKKFGAAASWQSFYMTRAMSESFPNDPAISGYFKQNRLDRKWTLVDTGFSGKTSAGLGEFRPSQSLFFVSENAAVPGFANQPFLIESLCKARRISPENREILYDIGDSTLLSVSNFMDLSPRLFKSPKQARALPDGKFRPILERQDERKRRYRTDYYSGLAAAVSNYGDLPPPENLVKALYENHNIQTMTAVLEGWSRAIDQRRMAGVNKILKKNPHLL